MVELLFKPYVAVCASTALHSGTINNFVDAHGLTDLALDDNTPIGRMLRQIDGTIKPSTDVYPYYRDMDLLAEFAGRFCYRSFGNGRSTEDYLENIIEERHGNVLAHSSISFIVTGVSRSLSHELVRHHVGCNPSQESQRFVTAEEGTIDVVGYRATRAVVPPLLVALFNHLNASGERPEAKKLIDKFKAEYASDISAYNGWIGEYKRLLDGNSDGLGVKFDTMRKKRILEAARAKLPNAAETRLVWTMNLRAARHVIERRGDIHADLEIRRLAVEFARHLKIYAPLSFQDAEIYTADDGFEAVRVQHIGV